MTELSLGTDHHWAAKHAVNVSWLSHDLLYNTAGPNRAPHCKLIFIQVYCSQLTHPTNALHAKVSYKLGLNASLLCNQY